MNVRTTKARNFAFIIYPESIPENWVECLEKLGISMAISPLHDKDKSDIAGQVYKKAHYHVLYIARNPVTVESVRKKVKRVLGNSAISHIEIVDSVEYYYQYLTHESSDAIRKNKHVYDKKDIIYVNDFDIDRYITLDENQKRELKNKLLDIVDEYCLVNTKDLMAFIKIRGDEFGILDLNYVKDVVSANSSAFRLWFEGNYQCGYRAKYAQINIDKETGEILDV